MVNASYAILQHVALSIGSNAEHSNATIPVEAHRVDRMSVYLFRSPPKHNIYRPKRLRPFLVKHLYTFLFLSQVTKTHFFCTIHQDIFEDVGTFKEDYPVCEDYDLWLRICSKYNVHFDEQALINKYGGHEDQLSRKFHSMDYWRVKSLMAIKDQPQVLPEERQQLEQVLKKKLEILRQGYKKHQNFENWEEVDRIYNQLEL